jgi:hypothetical protein
VAAHSQILTEIASPANRLQDGTLESDQE